MLEAIGNHLAKLRLRFAPEKERWMMHLARFLPVMQDAFPEDYRTHLLILRLLDDLEQRHAAAARQKLTKLQLIVRKRGGERENALFQVLLGVFHLCCGDTRSMAACMRAAEKYGHRFHMPHMLLGVHYIYDCWSFERACGELDKAINCIYGFPPLDENRRRGVGGMQSLMAYAQAMMHNVAEARRLLTLAGCARDTAEYLHAEATVCALEGRADEAEAALAALEKADENRARDYAGGIRQMLAGTHPHFAAKEPDQEAIAAYWAWFSENERELRRLLVQQGPQTCYASQRDAFRPLVPEPANIDMMSHSFVLADGKPEIHLFANHSRTYQALLDALLAACPPQVQAHWTLRAFPGGSFGSPQEAIAHYGGAAKIIPREEKPA